MRNLIAFSAVALLATTAIAAPWQVDPATSTLTFEGHQSGESFKGSFAQFTPVIDFDPAHPERGKIDVTVEMISATVDGKDRNDALPTEDWFGVKKFPRALFHATKIIAGTHANSFSAQGDLTIRGISKPATIAFTLIPEGKSTRAQGDLTVNRKDYGVGQGQWADDKWIAFPVAVHFDLHATQK